MSKGITFTDELRDYLVDHSLPPTPQHDALVDRHARGGARVVDHADPSRAGSRS